MNRLKDKLARLHGKKQSESADLACDDSSSASNSVPNDSHAQHTIRTSNSGIENLAYQFDDAYYDVYKTNRIGLYTNEFGSFLFKRTSFSLEHAHGMYKLDQLQEVVPFLNRFNKDDHPLSLHDILFFDLETTGLGTGTGNIPFMVGLAYFEHNTCIVEQAVIRHVAEERALLAYFHRLTSRFTHLITYNGKSFDWPLLVNRYIINGMREDIWQPKHIDLLHPSRFIWRNALESCKLSHIEEARLGITRVDDLPGSEAPDRYFKYLADFNPEHLLPVFQHNELDMLTLVSLLTRFGYLLTDQDVSTVIQLPTEPEEMIRTGLWLEKMGLTRQCELLFNIAITLPPNYAPTLYALSLRDKQIGQLDRAIYLWEMIINSEHLEEKAKLDCAIQLAIYYEHKQKDFVRASHYTEYAIQINNLMNIKLTKRDKGTSNREQELTKRFTRLQNKLLKQE